MLQRLYDIFFTFKEYLVLTLLIILSLVLLALNDNPQVKRVRTISTVVFGFVGDRLMFLPRYVGLHGENEILRRLNVELADEAYQLREAKLENVRLRQLLALKERSRFNLVGARVVGKSLTHLRNTLTLNVGTSDGVLPHMPVLGDGGLVGIVTDASRNYSVVNIVLNTDFRASAKVQRSRVDGIIAWDGRSLFLKNIPKTLDVEKGDVVITSEYSSAFPPDIKIGLVTEVEVYPSTLFKTVMVVPGVDFVKLEEVFVLQYTPNAERDTLEESATGEAEK
ncbi:MAG: rod shape-determining protein MreC [Bacteroidota bacterium]